MKHKRLQFDADPPAGNGGGDPTPQPQFKEKDDILGIVKSMQDVLSEVATGSAEQKSKQEKMAEELKSFVNETKEFQTVTQAALADISEESKAATSTAFDVMMKEPNLRRMWGYADPVERALYRGHVAYDYQAGEMAHDGKGYELDDIVYQLNDAIYIYAMHKALTEQRTNPGNPQTYTQIVKGLDSYKLLMYELGRQSELSKALNTATDGSGADWVPTGMSAQLIDEIRLSLRVAGLFQNITMPAGSGSWDVPQIVGRNTAYLIGEPVSNSPSKIPAATPNTSKVTFVPKTHGLRMLFSDDIEEDSMVAMLPLVRSELVMALRDAMENGVINGDTDATHMDSDVTASNDVRKGWDGLREYAGGSSGQAAVDISTLNIGNLRSIRKKMGRFGAMAEDNAWLTGVSGFVQLLGLDEVKTADKWGANFTAKSGTIAVLDGSPVIVSEFIREDLNASGVYDGTTTSKTQILYANTKAHWTAQKPSGLKVESDRDIETQQTVAVASRRVSFTRSHTPGSGEATVGLGYNLAS